MDSRTAARAFAFAEMLTVVVVVAIVGALLVLASHDQHRLGRVGADLDKLGRIGALTGQYAADNADQFWTFSWRKGQALSKWGDLNNAATDQQAAANQAVDFFKRQGRVDIHNINLWIPHLYYSHLPLEDGGYTPVPDLLFVSAADRNRTLWARDPLGFDQGRYVPHPTNPGPPANDSKRWPYSGSFQLDPSFWDRGIAPNRVGPGGGHKQLITSAQNVLGSQLTTRVSHPSHKAHTYDANARHFGVTQPYCTHDQARLPLLFVDRHARVAAAAEANPGWNPNAPASAGQATFPYTPDAWEPPTVSGLPAENVSGRFRWTRGLPQGPGVGGRDFAGPEVYIPPP